MSAVPLRSGLSSQILLLDWQDRHPILTPVDADRQFHSGEAFRLSVSAAREGCLYLVLNQSQGDWRLLFPTLEAEGLNWIQPPEKLSLPDRGWYRFDQHPGVEDLYIVWSPTPIPIFDNSVRISDGVLGDDDLLSVPEAIAQIQRLRLAHDSQQNRCTSAGNTCTQRMPRPER